MSEPIARLNAALEGRYRIDRELGTGGTATVYVAEDLRHERKVALKVLKPDLALAIGADRFLAEIRTTAALRHPRILPLFDSGQAESFLFYTMPLVDGESLRHRLDRERQLPVDEAVRLASGVADALDYAHRQGIVHRDIKPENILLQDGETVVADFGIALAIGSADSGRLTETGLGIGTPAYMSPEQTAGDRNVGAATDIYALGCVLYEMLAGELPFTGPTPQAILARVMQRDPDPVSRHRRSVPPNIEAAIRRALEKVPADRFATAREFSNALRDPGFRHGDPASAGTGIGRWRGLAVAGWAVALVALALVARGVVRNRAVPAAVSQQILSTDGWVGVNAPLGQLSAVAPDGSSVVLPLGAWPTRWQLGLKQRGSVEVVPIPGTEQARDVAFSPDGQWLVYVSGGNVIKTHLVNGGPVTLAEGTGGASDAVAWLDDGTILYEQMISTGGFFSPSRIVRIPEAGGAPIQMIEPAAGLTFPIWIHALPNARGALVVGCAASFTCTSEGTNLYAIDLPAGTVEMILEGVMRAWFVEQLDRLVFVRPGGAVFTVPFDLRTLRPNGSQVLLFDGVRGGENSVDIVIGNDGTVLYVEGEARPLSLSTLVWVDRSGAEEPMDPGMQPMNMTTLALSPDNRKVAVSIEDGESSGLWVKELPDGPLTQVAAHSASLRWPAWSEDGASLIYITNAGHPPHIRRVRSDAGSGAEPGVLLSRDNAVFEAAMLPGTNSILFLEDAPDGSTGLGLLDAASGTVTEEPRSSGLNERTIAVSPDGRWFAYRSAVSGSNQVYVRGIPDTGGRTQVSTNGGSTPVWAHNGSELFYRESGTGDMIVATYVTEPEFRITSRARLFDARRYVSRWGPQTYAITNDDRRFAMLRGETGEARVLLIENWFTELAERVSNRRE